MWIVGEHRQQIGDDVAWDFVGIFDTEAAAVAACTKWEHFVGPVALNVRLSDERHEWDGCYYPLARQSETSTCT